MQMSARKLSKAFPAKIKVHEDQCFGSRALRMVWEYVKNIWNPKIICFLIFSCVAWDFHQFVSLFLPLSLSQIESFFLIADFSRFVIFLLTCSKLHIAWHDNWRNAKPVCTTCKMRTSCSSPNRISFGSTLSFFLTHLWMCAALQFNFWYCAVDNCAALSCLCATWGWKLLWWMSLTPM